MITLVLKDEDLKKEMKRLRYVGKNWKVVLEAFGAHMLGSTEDVFKKQGKPEKWKPLKIKTIIARFTRGNRLRKLKKRVDSPAFGRFLAGAKILIDKGRLKNSMGFRVRRNVLEYGTNVIYAAAQHFGFKKKNVPARPFLFFLKADVDRFEEIILNWMEKGGL